MRLLKKFVEQFMCDESNSFNLRRCLYLVALKMNVLVLKKFWKWKYYGAFNWTIRGDVAKVFNVDRFLTLTFFVVFFLFLFERLCILWWPACCVSVRSSYSSAAGTFSSTTACQTSRSAPPPTSVLLLLLGITCGIFWNKTKQKEAVWATNPCP